MMATKTFRWIGPVADPYYYGRSSNFIGTKSAIELSDYLEKNKEDKAHVIISSNGGSAFIATRVLDMVNAYRSRITAEINGLAASAGSIIAIGIADKLYSRKSSMMMIHGPSTFIFGNKKALLLEVKLMDKIEEIVTQIYMEKSNLTKQELQEAYDGELWLTSNDMQKRSIVSKILKDNEQVAKIVEEGLADKEDNNDNGSEDRTDKTNASLFKLFNMPMDRIAAALEHDRITDILERDSDTIIIPRDTEDSVDETLEISLKAEIAALKDKVTNLEKSKKDLEIKLNHKDKELKKQGSEAVVDSAIEKKVIDAEERDKWLKRLEDAPETVKEILESMEPNPLFTEKGSDKEKKAELGDIPDDIVNDYRYAKFTDEEIIAAWNDEVRPSDKEDK